MPNLVPAFIGNIMDSLEQEDPAVAQVDVKIRKSICDTICEEYDPLWSCVTGGTKLKSEARSLEEKFKTHLVSAAAMAGSLKALVAFVGTEGRLLWEKSSALDYPLVAAARGGDEKVVQAMTTEAISNARSPLGYQVLYRDQVNSFRGAIELAIKYGHVSILQCLINTSDKLIGAVPSEYYLMWLKGAIHHHQKKCLDILLTACPTEAGFTEIHEAFKCTCIYDDFVMARKFILHGSIKLNKHIAFSDPLATAILTRAKRVVIGLLKLGAHPDGPPNVCKPMRPLSLAYSAEQLNTSLEICKILLDAGANPYLASGAMIEHLDDGRLLSRNASLAEALERALQKFTMPEETECREPFA